MENSDNYSVCRKLDVDSIASVGQSELRQNLESHPTSTTERLDRRKSHELNHSNNSRNLNSTNKTMSSDQNVAIDNNEKRSLAQSSPSSTPPPLPSAPASTIQDGCVHYKRKAKFVVSSFQFLG